MLKYKCCCYIRLSKDEHAFTPGQFKLTGDIETKCLEAKKEFDRMLRRPFLKRDLIKKI